MRLHKLLPIFFVFFIAVLAPVTAYAANVVGLTGLNFLSNNVGIITLTPTLSLTAPAATGVEYQYKIGTGDWLQIGISTNDLDGFKYYWDTKDMYVDTVYVRARTTPSGTWFVTDAFKCFNIFTTAITGIGSPATGVVTLRTTIPPDPPYVFPPNFPEGQPSYIVSSNYEYTAPNLITPKTGTITTIRSNFIGTGTISNQWKLYPGPGTPSTSAIYTGPAVTIGGGLQTHSVNISNVPQDVYVGMYHQVASPSWNSLFVFWANGQGGTAMPSYGSTMYYRPFNNTSWYSTTSYNGPAIEFTLLNPYTDPIEVRFGYKDGSQGTPVVIGVATKNPDDSHTIDWNTAGFGSDRTYVGSSIRTGAGWNSWKWQGPYLVTNPAQVSFTNNLGHGIFFIDDVQFNIPHVTTWNFLETHTIRTPALLDEEQTQRYRFDNWSNGGDRVQTINFKVDSPKLYTATYIRQYLFTVTNQTGEYLPGSSGTGWYDTGAILTSSVPASFAIEDGVRYACIGWTGTGSIGNGTTNTTGAFQITTGSTVVWNWSRQYYFSVSTPYGELFGSTTGWYNENAELLSYVDSPAAIDANNRWMCVGWSSAEIGDGTVSFTGQFNITKKTTVQWLWKKQFRLLGATNLGTILPRESWHFEQTPPLTVELTAFSPGDTSEQQFQFLGWTGEEFGSTPSGTLSSIIVTMDKPKSYTAHWSARYYVTAVAQNGSLNPPVGQYPDGYDGWYPSGTTMSIAVLPPDPEPGVRFVVGWSGVGITEYEAAPNNPNPLPITVNGPVTVFATWVRQYSLQIIDLQQVGVSSPMPGTYWFYTGETVSGWTAFRTQGLVSRGFIGTGSATSSDIPFFEFVINEPSSVTWLWGTPDTMFNSPEWSVPAEIAKYAGSGIASLKRMPDGSPIIAYYSTADNSIKVGWYRSGQWTIHKVYTITSKADDVIAYEGNNLCLAVDSRGVPHVAFYNPAVGVVMSVFTGATWTPATIDSIDDPGRFLSFEIGPGNIPHFAYYSAKNGDLVHTRLENNVLHRTVVDEVGNVGLFTDIAISPRGGLPRISYYDATNSRLKCAILNNAWDIYVVDSSADVGVECAISLDPAGLPIIAYQEKLPNSMQGLRCAFFIDSAWQIFNLDRTTLTGFGIDIIVDVNGNPLVTYHDYNALRIAFYNGLVWNTSVLITSEVTGRTSLTMDENGNPAIAFWSGETLYYLDAKTGAYTGPIVVDEAQIAPPAQPAAAPSGGGGCFIATAAFGSLNADVVEALVSLRDSSLDSAKCSIALVSLYYLGGTDAAKSIALSDATRSVLRGLLSNIVK